MILMEYPVATVSAILSYCLIATLLLPRVGYRARSLFAHPIPTTQDYLLAFDTLRGLAAMLVAVGHLWYFAYPITAPIQLQFHWIGYAAKAVPMFAMLSGFLIYRSIRKAETFEHVREYLYRRFFRIYPLYFVSVIGMLLCSQTATKLGDYPTISFVAAEIFMFRVFDAPFFSNPATWSLYVEVSFYAFMPLFIIMTPKHKIMHATIILAIGLVIADQWHAREFYMWKYFFFGVFASELALKTKVTLPIGIMIFAIGLIWLCLDMRGPDYDVFARLGFVPNPSKYTIGLGIAFGLILYGVGFSGPVARILNFYPLRFLGIISYSVFLLHPFYLLANFRDLQFFRGVPNDLFATFPAMPSWYFAVIYVPGVLVWAAVGFLLVERPGLEFGKRWLKDRRERRLAFAATPA